MVKKQKNKTKQKTTEKMFIKNYCEINFESILVEVSFEYDLKDQEEELEKSLGRVCQFGAQIESYVSSLHSNFN